MFDPRNVLCETFLRLCVPITNYSSCVSITAPDFRAISQKHHHLLNRNISQISFKWITHSRFQEPKGILCLTARFHGQYFPKLKELKIITYVIPFKQELNELTSNECMGLKIGWSNQRLWQFNTCKLFTCWFVEIDQLSEKPGKRC